MSQKIMVVDDSKDMRALMRVLLESEGYEIDEAADGRQALDNIAKKYIPDLIFLDHNMPVMNGPEFVTAFEKEYPKLFSQVPVILLTGLDSKDIVRSQATEIVNKNQGIQQLLQLVAKHLK